MSSKTFKWMGGMGLGVMLVLSGCGGKKKATGSKTGAAPSPTAVNDTPKPVAVWQAIENPVEPAFAYCDLLMYSGDYERALMLLSGLKEQYPSVTMPPEYDERLKAVQDLAELEKTLSPQFAGFIKEDGAAYATVRDSGEPGMIVLRKQLLDNGDEALSTAIVDFIVAKDDVLSAYAILQRWKRGASSALEIKLLSGLDSLISKHSQTHEALNAAFLENMLLVLVAERSDKRRAALRKVVAKWKFKAMDTSILKGYRTRLLSDKTYDEIHLMELMTVIYTSHCKSDSAAFDSFFGLPTHDMLISYLTPATTNSSRSIATIAKEIGPLLGLPDLGALNEEMALHYTFNAATSTGYIVDPRTTRIRSKMLNGLSANSLQSGLEGKSLMFEGKQRLDLSKLSFFKEKERKYLSRVGSGNYSFSVWVNPKLFPTKSECKKSPFAIVSGEANVFGLYLSRDTSVLMIHPLESSKNPCVAKTTTKVPQDKWTHLVSVVDRRNGTVKIYVDGLEAGKASFQPNARPVNSYIVKKLMLGSPGSYGDMGMGGGDGIKYKYDDNAYIGLIDELRIYARAISPAEVKQIYQIHAGVAQ